MRKLMVAVLIVTMVFAGGCNKQDVGIETEEVDMTGQDVETEMEEADITGQDVETETEEEDMTGQDVEIETEEADMTGQDVETETEEEDMTGQDVAIETEEVDMTWRDVHRVKKTDKNIEINDIKKLYFDFVSGYTADVVTRVAVDFEENTLYLNVSLSSLDRKEPTRSITPAEAEEIKEMVSAYTSGWEHTYGPGYQSNRVDQYGWNLYLVDKYGTVESYSGAGQTKKECIPDNFEDFASALTSYAEESTEQ